MVVARIPALLLFGLMLAASSAAGIGSGGTTAPLSQAVCGLGHAKATAIGVSVTHEPTANAAVSLTGETQHAHQPWRLLEPGPTFVAGDSDEATNGGATIQRGDRSDASSTAETEFGQWAAVCTMHAPDEPTAGELAGINLGCLVANWDIIRLDFHGELAYLLDTGELVFVGMRYETTATGTTEQAFMAPLVDGTLVFAAGLLPRVSDRQNLYDYIDNEYPVRASFYEDQLGVFHCVVMAGVPYNAQGANSG